MDPMIAKIILSRKKSIAKLDSEIAALDAQIKASGVPSVVAALTSLKTVRVQRRSKLAEEVAGLELVDDRQLEVPGSRPGKGR